MFQLASHNIKHQIITLNSRATPRNTASPSVARSKAAMDPPEMIHMHYSLGDPGKRKHITHFTNVFHNQMAIASLKPNDPCFLRSGNWFTFAKVLSRKHGPEADIEFVVDENGCTMTIPLRQCVRHVRTIKSLSAVQHHEEDYPPSFTDERSNEAVDIALRRGEWLQVKQHILRRSDSEQSRHLDRLSTGSSSCKPVLGGRRASLDDRTAPPHPQLSLSRPEAGARARLDRPQRTLSVPSLNKTVRDGRRASGKDRTASPHPQLSLSRPDAEAPAGLYRPQRRFSVPSLKNTFRVVRQSSIDVSQLRPSSSVPKIHAQCRPATRRSSLPLSPFDDQSDIGLETSINTSFDSTSPESHPERRANHPPKTNLVCGGRRNSCVKQSRSYSSEPVIESRQTGPPPTPLRRYPEHRSNGLFSYMPVSGGRRPNEVASPPQSRLNRQASAVAAADLLNLISYMSSHSPTDATMMHDDDVPSAISSSKIGDDDVSKNDAGIKINVESSSGEKYPTGSKPTNYNSSKPIRDGRRASLDDRTTSRRPQLSHNRPEGGGRARLFRPQQTLSVSSLSNPVYRRRRATLDHYQASPVDVSRFSPSSPESKIHTKICRPTPRRSSLPPPPFTERPGTGLDTNPDSHSERRANLSSQTEFVRGGMVRPAAVIESKHTRLLQKPPRKHLERRSSGVFPGRPVCGSRRMSLDPPRSSLHRPASAVTAADDLLNLIASNRVNRPKERMHVPIVTVTHDDDAPSDVSSSEGEEDDNSNNNAAMRVNVNSSLNEKFPTALKHNIDIPGLDTAGLNDQFWLEAWYALD